MVDDELRKLLLAKQKEEALKNHVGGQAGVFLRTSLTSAVRQSAILTCFLTLTYELWRCEKGGSDVIRQKPKEKHEQAYVRPTYAALGPSTLSR